MTISLDEFTAGIVIAFIVECRAADTWQPIILVTDRGTNVLISLTARFDDFEREPLRKDIVTYPYAGVNDVNAALALANAIGSFAHELWKG